MLFNKPKSSIPGNIDRADHNRFDSVLTFKSFGRISIHRNWFR
jgi:hypothetical protein